MGALDRIFRGRRGGQDRPLAAQIAALFANGEQGLWYDIESFRDAWNGAGSELVTNGSFVSAAGWSLAATSWSIAGGTLNYSNSGSNSDAADCNQVYPSIAVGGWYLVTFTITSGTTPAGAFLVMRGTSIQIGGRGPGTYTVAGQAGASTAGYGIRFVGYSAGSFSVDNVSVREWTGMQTCALYQDASGTLPAYMPGKGQVDPPVGLLLDKRRGFALGPERLTNTGFQTLDGWTAVRGASATVSGGAVTVTTANPKNWGSVSTPIATVPGKAYLVTAYVTAAAEGVQLLVSESATTHVNVSNSQRASPGYCSLIFKATKAVHYVWLGSSGNEAGVSVSSWATPSAREISANYAYQATTTSRPTLSARYNLFSATEFSNGVTDAPTRGGLISATSLPGYAGAISFGHDGSTSSYAYKSGSIASAVMTMSVVVKMDDGLPPSFGSATNISPANDFVLVLRQSGSVPPPNYSVVHLGGGYYRVSASGNVGAGTDDYNGVVKYSTNSARTFKVTAFDLRIANDGIGLPEYQRVVDASTYDSVGFPLYLKFDGVDDFLQTASVDFSASDKILVSMAMRKLSDATAAVPLELSTVYTNAGAFAVIAPVSNAAPTIAFVSKGASASVTAADSTAVAPISTISTGYSDIGGKVAILRTNGLVKATTVVDQGGGNYGAYPLYIGRRAGTSLPFGGRVYGLLIRAGAANDAQFGRVERYLNQKAKVF